LNTTIRYFFALVWLINGLYCKILNQVPRHTEIVGKLLNQQYARELTTLIGLSEIVMAIWILSKWQSKLNSMTQISIIILMNFIEFSFASELLLWGKLNLVFACLFSFLIYWNQFNLKDKRSK
jgi:hypothetical protein